MTFDESTLKDALNKIITTSLFSVLTEEQQKQFYSSVFHMIDHCCYCGIDDAPYKVRIQLAEELRTRFSEQLAEMSSPKSN
ncbi:MULTISPECIES: hypothetical protein [Yersinia]|uniref:hypothetical protein n=1 Tax=Yersinia TaxID=629 RepID=UPI0005E832EE|nr:MULTISPECIES: hypothetical protein [Yersinia]EKN4687708.1 hypothetical protein [Yersinia ruckeri]ELI6453495.1 hypothetical protein [Yersinia ruckeri]ELM3741532.1 hypothetical protein [Yersinia ruckeri]MCW6563818.1 hypothetical protein [Yersinia ruckeri]MCW6573494.1 hypothetical protein [Yersinia ruckeri]